jgi:hypothetical protein
MESKRATKETGTGIYRIATAMRAKTHEITNINFVSDWHLPNRSVSTLWLLRQVSSVLSRNCRYERRRDHGEASFVATNSWHGNCMSTMGSAV